MLASIQKITSVSPVQDSDNLDVLEVLGWKIVSARGEFKEGDLCVYVEIDSVLPVKAEFEFLRKGCWSPRYSGFRVRTIKLRGQISQGICFPLSILPSKFIKKAVPDMDVTEILGVMKYEKQDSMKGISFGSKVVYPWWIKPFVKIIKRYNFLRRLFGRYIGLRHIYAFPSFIPKTDEERLQAHPEIFGNLKGKVFYTTIKYDGTSATYYYKDGVYGACSRNQEICNSKHKLFFSTNVYSEMAQKYDIEEKLRKLGRNIAIQGEIYGAGIQGNKMGLSEVEFRLFNIFDIDKHCYLNFEEVVTLSSELGLNMVDVLNHNVSFDDYTLEQFLKMAEINYANGSPAEGIVIRTMVEDTCHRLGRFSFKVINNQFLLKYKE